MTECEPINVGGAAPGGAGGGAGGGSIGATGTNNGKDDSPGNPTAAGNSQKDLYAASGDGPRPGAGAGAGGTGAISPDLLGLLNGMNKKEEGPPANANFGGAPKDGRDLASDGSLLGPEADLFVNVHRRYTEIQTEKRI